MLGSRSDNFKLHVLDSLEFKYLEISEKFAIREEELLSSIKTHHSQSEYLGAQFKQYEAKFTETDKLMFKISKDLKSHSA